MALAATLLGMAMDAAGTPENWGVREALLEEIQAALEKPQTVEEYNELRNKVRIIKHFKSI